MKMYLIGGLLAACLLSGCGTTLQTRNAPEPSGFLGDYSQLKSGSGDEAHLIYVNPKTDFKKYSKILLDPVKVYGARDSKIAKVPKEDLQKLVNYFDAALRDQLKSDYELVNQPGPGVMRLKVAITEAGRSVVALDILSSVTPPGMAMSSLKQIATGTPAMTGSVGIECQAVDCLSNERLFAAVDARAGQKYTGKFDKLNKWRAAQGAFDYWAKRVSDRLKEERAGSAK